MGNRRRHSNCNYSHRSNSLHQAQASRLNNTPKTYLDPNRRARPTLYPSLSLSPSAYLDPNRGRSTRVRTHTNTHSSQNQKVFVHRSSHIIRTKQGEKQNALLPRMRRRNAIHTSNQTLRLQELWPISNTSRTHRT